MRGRGLLAIGGGAVLVLAAGSALAVTAPPPSKGSPAPAAAARPAVAAKPKIVWTQADLDRLREKPNSRLTVVGAGGSISVPPATTTHDPEAVEDRYQALLAQADAEIARLERERLAAANPLLRGLGRDPSGAAAAPRPVQEIDSDIARWQARKAMTVDKVGTAGRRED